MKNLSVIGTSKIIHQHLECALKVGFKLHDICSTNPNSKNINKIFKKYKFVNKYKNWRKMLKDHQKNIKLKNNYYLIAPRIKDTDLILKNFINLKKRILVEKPVSLNFHHFKKYYKFKKNIFVAYNRIFYNSVLNLKKKKLNRSFVDVFVPEFNRENFKKNSCHVISVLYFLFGDLKLINKIKKDKFIQANLKDKNENFISFKIFYKASDNFSINIYNGKNTYIMKPLENFRHFKGIKERKLNKDKIYQPKLVSFKNEFKNEKFKPGFLKVWQLFVNSDNKPHPNNIIFAYKVMKICEEIIK